MALVVGGLLVGSSATASAQAFVLTFGVELRDCIVHGGANASDVVNIVWKSSDGNLKHKETVTADGTTGEWQTACDYNESIESGDTIKGTIGASTRTLTIPPMSMTINRVTDKVSGHGPSSAGMQLRLYHYPGFDTSTNSTKAVTTNASGAFAATTVNNKNIIGWDSLHLGYTSPSGDKIGLWQDAPTVYVWLNRPDVRVRGNPGGDATTTLKSPGGTIKSVHHATLDPWGGDYGYFTKGGLPVRTRAGDTVIAPGVGSDAHWSVPAINVSATVPASVVTGHCQPGKAVELDIFEPQYNFFYWNVGFANGSGNYSHNFSGDQVLASGDKIQVWCKLATGDVVTKLSTIP